MVRIEENEEEEATMDDAIFGCMWLYLIYRGVRWRLGFDMASHLHHLTQSHSLFLSHGTGISRVFVKSTSHIYLYTSCHLLFLLFLFQKLVDPLLSPLYSLSFQIPLHQFLFAYESDLFVDVAFTDHGFSL